MKKGELIWADLSTYNTDSSKTFYEKVFGWNISEWEQYYLCTQDDQAIAGIFETPDFLKKINMPHFWMSYFQVKDVKATVELAKSLGAIIEIESADFYGGKIALVRDQQGAGFTIYDGEKLGFVNASIPNTIIKTELQVSKSSNVIPFYSTIFQWEIKQMEWGKDFEVYVDGERSNISIKQLSNDLKGKYEYWVTTLLVESRESTKKRILENGGSVVIDEGNRIMMTDNTGEAFFYIEEA